MRGLAVAIGSSADSEVFPARPEILVNGVAAIAHQVLALDEATLSGRQERDGFDDLA